MTLTPAPHRPPSSGFRSRRNTIANAASPRYASVLPPPVGKKSRSAVSRCGSAGVGEPRQVQQQEADLKGPPLRVRVAGSGRERPRDGAVRHPEGVEGVVVRGEHRDAALDTVGGQSGLPQQFFRRLPPGLGQILRLRAPGLDPRPVFRDQRPQHPLRSRPVRRPAERRHREFDARNSGGLDLLDLGPRNPRGAHRAAGSIVADLPVGGDAVSGRVFWGIGVVQVGDFAVPVARMEAARVGPSEEPRVAPHFDLRLERVAGPGLFRILRWRALVHEEDRDGAGSRRNPAPERGARQGPFDDVQPQPVRAGNVHRPHSRRSAERQRHGFAPRRPAPYRERFAVAVPRLALRIVAPAHGRGERFRLRTNQEAQPDGRREEPPLRGLQVLRRLLGESRPLRHLSLGIVLRVVVRPLFGRRSARDQEPGEVPVRRPNPPGQLFGRQRAVRTRPDEIQPQGLLQTLPDLGGVPGWRGAGRHVQRFRGSAGPVMARSAESTGSAARHSSAACVAMESERVAAGPTDHQQR